MVTRTALVSGAALVAGCAGARSHAVPAAGMEDVRLTARLLAAADERRPDIALLDTGLTHASAGVRRVAASAAGNIRVLALAPRLSTLARSEDRGVARAAAFALALLRDTSAVARLDSLLDVPNAEVARGAAWGLGELGGPARTTIERRLRSPAGQSPIALAELLLAASRLRPVPADAVTPLLGHADPGVEWTAAYALARSRVPAGARALLTSVSSTNALTRAYAARGLAHGTSGDSLAALALPALRVLATDAHPHVRISAARSLASFGPAGQAPLITLARDPDANVRIAAAQAIPATMRLAQAVLDSLWSADTLLTFRRAILVAAARSERSLARGASWAAGSDWQRRAALLDAAVALPGAEALPLLQRAAADRDGRVRAAAISALGAFADSAWAGESVLQSLRSALADADWQVRAAAMGALARGARAADANAAAGLLSAARGHKDASDARTAAVQLLVTLWRRDSTAMPAEALAMVRSLPAPADYAERSVASASPLFAHWRDGAAPSRGTLRPREWYEEVARRFALADEPPVAVIRTSRGVIELELFANDAPLSVENFVRLARSGYYRGASWHRVVPAFVAQDGDPRGDGSGGPGYAIRDEQNANRYERGVLGMALSGPNTGGSQYFITLAPQPHLDGNYTVFGRVLRGLEVLDALVQGDTIVSIDVR